MSDFLQYLISGIALGCSFALLGSGFVAIARVTQVANFAQGTTAVIGGLATYSLLSHSLPHGVAEILAIIAAGAVGLLIGMLALSRRTVLPLASLIITLGVALAAYGPEILIWGEQPVSYSGIPSTLDLAGAQLSYQYLLVIGVTLSAFAALVFFFGRTYLGKGMSACASNPYAARVIGIDTHRMGLVAFALGGMLGGLGGALLTPIQPLQFSSDIELAVSGFIAAIFGGLVSFNLALVGGLVLGVCEEFVGGYFQASYETIVALTIMLAVLVWRSRSWRSEEHAAPAWSAGPISSGPIRISTHARVAGVLAVLAIAFALPLVLSSGNLTVYLLMGLSIIVAVGLSLLLGYAGQISAGQAAFYSIGAYAAGAMTIHGVPSIVSLLVAPMIAGVAGLLIGIAVLRLRGNYLAFATLAFQLIVLAVINEIPFLGAAVGLQGIPGLGIDGVVIQSLRGYAWLVWGLVALVVLLSYNLVRSRPGRALRVLATDEAVAESAGIAVIRYKVAIFSMAAIFAGLAGALYAFFISYVAPDSFSIILSIQYIVMIAVGGIGTISGAVVGVTVVTLVTQWLNSLGTQPGMPVYMPPVLQYAAYGVMLIVVMRVLPAGLVSLPARVVDRARRQRHSAAHSGRLTTVRAPANSAPVDKTMRDTL